MLNKLSTVQKQNKSSDEITIVFVVHNEAESIQRTIRDFYHEIGSKIPLEIIVSEDGSKDGTKRALMELRKQIPLKLLMGDNRRGYMKGAKEGLKYINTGLVFVTDSDGQFIASDFWRMYRKLNCNDMVVGWKVERADPFYRTIFSGLFHMLIRIIFRIPLHDPNTAFRLFRRKVLDEVSRETRHLKYSFWTEFTVRAYKEGFCVSEVPINHRTRLHGRTRIFQPKNFMNIFAAQLTGLVKLWIDLRANSQCIQKE